MLNIVCLDLVLLKSFIIEIIIVLDDLIIFSSFSILMIGTFLSLYSSSNFCGSFLIIMFHVLFKCFSSNLLVLKILESILSILIKSLYGVLTFNIRSSRYKILEVYIL